MMSKPIITKQMLLDAKACDPHNIKLFERTFGDSVVMTVAKAREVAGPFNSVESFWKWAAIEFLDDEAQAEYDRDIDAGVKEYFQTHSLLEFHRTVAAAFAKAFIAMHKRSNA